MVFNKMPSFLTDKRFYKERKSFLCIDGSKMIPFEQVNDDYCDCADGSDEPGESHEKLHTGFILKKLKLGLTWLNMQLFSPS